MEAQNIRKVAIRTTLTNEDVMKLIQHLAQYGTEATHLDIQLTQYREGDMNVQILVNSGFGVLLKGTEAVAVIAEEVKA